MGAIIYRSGGFREFCAAHSELSFTKEPHSDGYVHRQLLDTSRNVRTSSKATRTGSPKKRVEEVSALDVVAAILDLLDATGGKASVGKVFFELAKMNPAFNASTICEDGSVSQVWHLHWEQCFGATKSTLTAQIPEMRVLIRMCPVFVRSILALLTGMEAPTSGRQVGHQAELQAVLQAVLPVAWYAIQGVLAIKFRNAQTVACVNNQFSRMIL